MASMQVINNAFNNLNEAFSTIMQHNRQQRAMDIEEQYQKDLLAYRQAIAAQDQANKDREYQRLVEQAKQTQKNWNKNFNYNVEQHKQNRATAERQYLDAQAKEAEIAKQNKFKEMFNIAKVYGADMAEAFARAEAGDPIARNMFMQGIDKYNQNQKSQQLYLGLLNNFNTIKKEQEKQAIAEQKNQNYLLNNILKTEDPVKTYENLLKIKRMMNNENQGNIPLRSPLMTPVQALQAFNNGEITKEQLAEYRKNF